MSSHRTYHELEASPYEVPHELEEDLYGQISSNDIQAIDRCNIKLVYELQIFFVEMYIIIYKHYSLTHLKCQIFKLMYFSPNTSWLLSNCISNVKLFSW